MKMTLSVRGRTKEWNFFLEADPKYLVEWRADGLQIDPVSIRRPQWVSNLGLARLWDWLFEDRKV